MAQKTRLNWKKIILLAFCVYAAVRLVYGFGEIYNLKQQKAQVDAQIEAAMTEQNNLQLGYVMPGEVVLKKIETDNSSNE